MKARTRVVLSYDDLNAELLTIAEPIFTAAGMRATLYASPVYIGSANKLTDANIRALYDLGWDIGVQQYNDVGDAFANVTSTGLTRSGTTATFKLGAVKHLLETGDDVTIRGCADPRWNATFGPITVTDAHTFTFACAGTETTPALGSPEAVRSDLQARMSRAETELSVTRVWDYFATRGMTRGNEHLAPSTGAINATVLSWMQALGIKTCRGTGNQGGVTMMPRCFDAKALLCNTGKLYAMSGSTMDQATGSACLGYVDAAMIVGADVFLYGHKVAPGVGIGTALTMDTTELQALITGLKARRDRGEIEVLTISEYYSGAIRSVRPVAVR